MMLAQRTLSFGVLIAAVALPALASASPGDCPRPPPLQKAGSVAKQSGAGGLGNMLRLFTVSDPCDERQERLLFLHPSAALFDGDDRPVVPARHFIETFEGRALACRPEPFDRAEYAAMIENYKQLARAKQQARKDVPPLVLYVHGGLVPGAGAFSGAAERLCQFYPDGCGDAATARETPGALRGFPIFVVWHSGLAEGLLRAAFSSRVREATAHGVVNRILQRPRSEQDLFDFCATHDDQTSEFNLNHIETLFRTYNYLSAPNVWHFFEDEIADTFMLPGDAQPTRDAIDQSDRVGLWLVRDIADLQKEFAPTFRVVVVGHSMGAEWGSWLIETYDRYAGPISVRDDGMRFDVASLAPAVPYTTFERALRTGRIGHFRMFTMDDAHERDDHLTELDAISEKTKGIYPLSLLYFISGVLNTYPDYPLLGMQRYISDPRYTTGNATMRNPVIIDVKARLAQDPRFLALSPGPNPPSAGMQACAVHHGDFDGDPQTVQSIKYLVNFEWKRSPSPGDAESVPPPLPCSRDRMLLPPRTHHVRP